MYINENSKIEKRYKPGRRVNSFYISQEEEKNLRYKSGKKENSFYMETEEQKELYDLRNVEDVVEVFFYDEKDKKIKSEFRKV